MTWQACRAGAHGQSLTLQVPAGVLRSMLLRLQVPGGSPLAHTPGSPPQVLRSKRRHRKRPLAPLPQSHTIC